MKRFSLVLALFAGAGPRPPDLAAASAAGDDGARLRVIGDPGKELKAFIVGPYAGGLRHKRWGLYDREHVRLYVNDVVTATLG